MRRSVGFVIITGLVSAAVVELEGKTEERVPKINVVLLDHASAPGKDTRTTMLNDWTEWDGRLPRFIPALRDVASFARGKPDKVEPTASLFSICVPADLGAMQRQALIASELKSIFNKTGRPSCILARSSEGGDQMCIVFQDRRDYPPDVAAELVIRLGESAPPNCLRITPREAGPFQPPPSVVLDCRPNGEGELESPSSRARKRWAVLKEGYLLGQYVLHCIAVLNESLFEETGTFYRHSLPTPGSKFALLVDSVDDARSLTKGLAMRTMSGKSLDLVHVSPEGTGFRVSYGPGLLLHKSCGSPEEAQRFITTQDRFRFRGGGSGRLV
jgi:hypothetical protein